MNGYTQNDLSAGIVKLDYQALLASVTAGYREIKNRLYREFSTLGEADDTGDNVKRYLTAKYIHRVAKDLAVAADTLSALVEGIDRPDKVFVNVPPVEEEKAPA